MSLLTRGYWPTLVTQVVEPAPPSNSTVCVPHLRGQIRTSPEHLVGTLQAGAPPAITGVIKSVETLSGTLDTPETEQLTGVVKTNKLTGRLKDEC